METETLRKGKLPNALLTTFRRNLIYLSRQAGGYYQLANHDETIGKDISGVVIMGCGALKAKKITDHLGRPELLETNIVPENENIKVPHLKTPPWKEAKITKHVKPNGNGFVTPKAFTEFVPSNASQIVIEWNGAKFSVSSSDLLGVKMLLRAIKEVKNETV